MRATPPWSRWFYLLALATIAIGLPWSKAMLSIGMMALGAAWLSEGVVTRSFPRVENYFGNKEYLIASAMFLPYLLGLLWTQDMQWGMKLLAIVLPLLLYPFYFAILPPLKEKERSVILLLFVGSTALISALSYGMVSSEVVVDFRSYSPLISHIRLGLMACFSIGICAWVIIQKSHKGRWGLLFLMAWFVYYLALLASIQGFVILAVIAAIALVSVPNRYGISSWFSGGLIGIVAIGAALFVANAYNKYSSGPSFDKAWISEQSSGGERYTFGVPGMVPERGSYVWHFVAENELRRTWNRRSELNYDGPDEQGNELKYTLCRYLNSLGLRKDSVGLSTLNSEDVKRIEQGIAWFDHGKRNAIRERLDMVFFELDAYSYRNHVEGSSVAMRLLYWQVAWRIFKENSLFGVGTGDTQLAFDSVYNEDYENLGQAYRLRAHQQYLTWLISWGVVGTLFMFAFITVPIRLRWKMRHSLFVTFLVVCAISFLTDDTMERQIGVTFFAFFYALLLLLPTQKELPDIP